MGRCRVREPWFAAALAAVAACRGGALQGGSGAGGRGGGGGAGGSIITGMNCAAVAMPATPSGLDVVVLLDASASMNDAPGLGPCDAGCGAGSKWAQATAAIDAVVAQTGPTVKWGLALLGDSDAARCAMPGTLVVPVAPATANGIAATFASRTSASGDLAAVRERLTRAAVNGAAAYFTASPGDDFKLTVLVTDGAPSCNSETAGPNGNANDNDTALTVDAITYAAQRGFPTYVVGVATAGGADDAFLEQMALAGGVARTGSPAYYPVASTSDLVTVLNDVVAGSSCMFAIPPPPNSDVDRQHIGVSVGGTEIARDPNHANGWDYTDLAATHVQVYGPPCDAIMNQAATHEVAVFFKCVDL
jgi:hypothetical protein